MNVQKSFFESVFFLRTSSFPARRKSSSALSRAGNDRGLMTNMVQAPLFGHQVGVNGLPGQRSFGFVFLRRHDGYSPSCRFSVRSRNGTPFLLSLHSSCACVGTPIMAPCLSQSKDFFDSGVYVRFLRSRSGQKNRCGGHGSFPICLDIGPEANHAVAAV